LHWRHHTIFDAPFSGQRKHTEIGKEMSRWH
jgi:hypothetical protein